MINFSYFSFFAANIFMSAWSVPKFQDVIAYFTLFSDAQTGSFRRSTYSQNQLLIFSSVSKATDFFVLRILNSILSLPSCKPRKC